MGNLFESTASPATGEICEPLLTHDQFLLERIVSTGQATSPGEWLIQDRQEWVLLLTGRAAIQFKGEEGLRVLRPGDYLLIPARTPHRVAWTEEQQKTIWLALHFK